MKFSVADSLFEKYPEVSIGVVVARGIDNNAGDPAVMKMLREQESKTRSEIQLEALAQHPLIQSWRKAYKAFGEKDDRASHEALIRRVLKGDSLRHINKLVDIYNYISLKHKVPAGGEDLDKVEGDIELKFADGSENFIALGSSETIHPFASEVIYADDSKVLCRKWNWRESDATKLTEGTKNAILVIESLPPFSDLETALEELASLVRKHCSAETAAFVLAKRNKQAELRK